MSKDVILKVENLSKQYRLGTLGTGTISHDFNRFLAKIRGKEDPYLKIGESNDRASKGESEYVWALKDINFEVKRGEVLGIIGKNGAGKSTLLKILSKVTGPTTGSIKSNGRIASLLEVGTGFHPEMTGKENIFLNGAILGMTKKEIASKLDEIVSFSGCERYIDTPVKRYSSGMKVRLAFAVAAHLEPDILIVDEVLAVGDAEFQKKAIGKMQDISGEDGRTVLFVSHDMTAIQNLCPISLLLDDGKVSFKGETSKVISEYLKSEPLVDLNSGKIKFEGLVSTNGVELKSLLIQDNKLSQPNILNTYGNGFFELFFESKNLEECNIQAAFTIKNLINKPLLTFSTTFRKQILKKGKKDSIKCSFENLNLIPGTYMLHIWFVNNADKEIIIENTCKIKVVEKDVFNSGVLPTEKYHGHIISNNFKWE
ncbi:polysaccharide ABC transporter ATP-binding protein [Polaribacter sp. Hel1_85]|uniref:ABC transporter ATP-binding protein n=1 Tax=Polaribacter sp. Hel1_85 TaxID=1250005 RepID=UPI00052CF2FC|nr:ABC transporter ATP-binding protein [Polaribacter sp. Hel1_85]KGL63229.1 polysaccharide ABC transporter, ATP-binding protein [Polaribacter sp. Hel1_85]